MTKRLTILSTAAIAVCVIAYAADKPKCSATAKECEYQIREMLSKKRYLGAKVEDSRWGVVVSSIIPGSPAAQAGLQVGDRIFAVNGRECGRGGTKQFKTLLNQAAEQQGGRVSFSVVRLGKLHRITPKMTYLSKEEIDKVVATHFKDAHPEIGN